MIGAQLGKYRIDRKLGSGGMATVYAATHTTLGSPVAIKVLHEHLADQASFRERFLREAQAAAALRHPGVTQVFDVEATDDVCYIAMELLEGETLEARLAARGDGASALPVPEAVEIIGTVGEALAYAHRQGIIHRDVKPANVMITRDGRIVLADFGLAAVMDQTRITAEGTTAGTPSYMSPEQVLGDQGDARSDIYSLGVMLYQLVSGALPFASDTLAGMLQGHLEKAPPPLADKVTALPPGIERAVEIALRKRPEERFATVDDMLACVRGETATSAAEAETLIGLPTGESQGAPEASHPRAVRIAAVAVVVTVLGGGAWWWSRTAGLPGTTDGTSSMATDGTTSMASDDTASMAVGSMAAMPGWQDAFDTNTHGWAETDGEVRRAVTEGAYEVELRVPDRAVAAQAEEGGSFQDLEWTATGELVDGAPETGYGLVFRHVDARNYGVFGINGLGQWSVWVLDDGAWRELRGGASPWTPHPAIRAGAANTLTVRAVGDRARPPA